MNDYDGLFVTVEGIDGSGKSTLVHTAQQSLHDVHTSLEPSTLWTGKVARDAIMDDNAHPLTNFHFFLGDRAEHIDKRILPELEKGRTVISDRYSDSTRAYQQEALDGHVNDPAAFIDYNLGQPWHLEPDLTILIDIPAEESARRTGERDKYEKSEFLSRVRQNYLDLAEQHSRIIVIDGEKPQNFVKNFGLTLIQEAQVQRASVI